MQKQALPINDRLIAITAFMVFLGAAFLTLAQESDRSQEHGLKVGEKAPEFDSKARMERNTPWQICVREARLRLCFTAPPIGDPTAASS